MRVSIVTVLFSMLGCHGQVIEDRQIPPFPTELNTFMAIMRDFQSLDAVPELNSRVKDDTFVFHKNDMFRSTPSRPPLTSLSQFTPTTQHPPQPPSQFVSPSSSSFQTSFKSTASPARSDIGATFSTQERDNLIGHLIGLDADSLVLTPRQRLALSEEKMLREQSFPSISDSSNSRQQPLQQSFNSASTLGNSFKNFEQQNRFSSGKQQPAFRTSEEPFNRPAIRFLEDDIPSNKLQEPVLPDLVLEDQKVGHQLKNTLMTNQENPRLGQRPAAPQTATKTVPIQQSATEQNTFQLREQFRNQAPLPRKQNRKPLSLNTNQKPLPRNQNQNLLVQGQSSQNFQGRPNVDTDNNSEISSQGSHPSKFLNQLSSESQQLFLDQFLSLNPDHQAYVYRKLLSAAPEIQKFAIEQFLSLDHRVLVVSVQAEIDRERSETQEQRIFEQQPMDFTGRSQNKGASDPLRNLQQFAQKTTNIRNLNPENLSIAELRSLQEQRQLEEQQQQLEEIIALQNTLNMRG